MIAGLRSYPENKATAQAWLGAVPRHWSVVPNRALFSEVKDRNHPDEEMLSVTITRGIVRQKALLAASSKKDSSNLDKSAYKLVQPRDIAYNKMRAWQGAIGASALRGIISPAYVVMRLREDDNLPSYFHYLYRTPQFAKEAERWSYGITSDMWSLRPEHFKMIYTPEPPPAEQAAIVRFLDWANGRLERAIRAKRKVIALLNEQKQAIIHRAVTRGLDPSVPLKPSGIPWLGDIPQHWEVRRLKHLAWFQSGNGITSLQIEATGPYPVYGGNGLRGYTTRHTHDGHYALIGRQGALCGNINYAQGQFFASEHAVVATLHEGMSVLWFGELLRVMNLNQYSQSAAQPGLAVERIKNLYAPVPPVREQQTIVGSFERSTAPLITTISRLEREIELLREYRTRLVADVVTGKLDVREAAAKLPEKPDDLEPLDDADALTEADAEADGEAPDTVPEEAEA